jgi:hypothetical protein
VPCFEFFCSTQALRAPCQLRSTAVTYPSRTSIKGALSVGYTQMNLLDLDQIKADARVIQVMLEGIPGDERCSRLLAASDAGGRILDCCERLSKRLKPSSTVPASPSAPDLEEHSEKAGLVEQSRRAGEFIIPFGKHKGKPVRAVPHSYLCWLLGVRRVRREFENVPMDKHGWIISNHADVIAQVKAYLTWRCWACGSADTRFKFSRLCSECWHECEAD